MLGNAPLILRDEMRKHWGDIPLIVCAESRYIGPDSTYMYNQVVPQKDRIYLNDLRKEYNMTFLGARAFIPESVQLMRRMIPKMKKKHQCHWLPNTCVYKERGVFSPFNV